MIYLIIPAFREVDKETIAAKLSELVGGEQVSAEAEVSYEETDEGVPDTDIYGKPIEEPSDEDIEDLWGRMEEDWSNYPVVISKMISRYVSHIKDRTY